MKKEAEEFLKKNYNNYSNEELAAILQVSVKSIHTAAHKLKLKKIGASERQIAFIKEHIYEAESDDFHKRVGLSKYQLELCVDKIRRGEM